MGAGLAQGGRSSLEMRISIEHYLVIGFRFFRQNRSAIFMYKSDPDFEIVIPIPFAIGKPIGIDQDPIFILQPDRDFSGKRLC
jgi:hypothetical protein